MMASSFTKLLKSEELLMSTVFFFFFEYASVFRGWKYTLINHNIESNHGAD
jgi:hypothetical protein